MLYNKLDKKISIPRHKINIVVRPPAQHSELVFLRICTYLQTLSHPQKKCINFIYELQRELSVLF